MLDIFKDRCNNFRFSTIMKSHMNLIRVALCYFQHGPRVENEGLGEGHQSQSHCFYF